ncbi:MAG: MaoC family dehydratase N-terminal domain-containing protein [Chloroflexota bacterium]|nr:MaoC family dehydratase N-terminal domain-containing protein [Chloroflexota bacterium]
MSEETVITAEIKEAIGKELVPAAAMQVTVGMIRRFAEAIDDPNPLWQDEEFAGSSRHGSIIAPPVFLNSLWPDGKNLKAMLDRLADFDSPLKRTLNGGQEFEYYQPVRPGDVITVTSKLTDAQERGGKGGQLLFLDAEVTYTNQRGELVAREQVTGVRH